MQWKPLLKGHLGDIEIVLYSEVSFFRGSIIQYGAEPSVPYREVCFIQSITFRKVALSVPLLKISVGVQVYLHTSVMPTVRHGDPTVQTTNWNSVLWVVYITMMGHEMVHGECVFCRSSDFTLVSLHGLSQFFLPQTTPGSPPYVKIVFQQNLTFVNANFGRTHVVNTVSRQPWQITKVDSIGVFINFFRVRYFRVENESQQW